MTTDLEVTFRQEWPRILGSVIRFTGDLALAEDAVQEAFARALVADAGALRNPASWITTTAKHVAVDWMRRDATLARSFGRLAADAADREAAEAEAAGLALGSIDDDRLELIFMVCHPELSQEARLCTALRAVCGVPTAEIADVFLVKEPTMAARLTRAKKRIQAAGIRLEAPDAAELAERTDDVLTTVYLLYTIGHTALAGHELSTRITTAAAISLARSIVTLRPRHLEARGLLALLLLGEARASGRVDADGDAVSLEEADRSRWNRALIDEGLALATIALAGRGRFALQAGISGLHCQAPTWEQTDWVAIVSLYDALATSWPSPAVLLNRVVARSYLPAVRLTNALAELDALEPSADGSLRRQTAAVRADLLRRAGDAPGAIAAYEDALAGESNEAVRAFVTRRIRQLSGGAVPRSLSREK